MHTGTQEDEKHCVLGFVYHGISTPKDLQVMMLDMTRMQYGEAGQGTYGENYFMGTLDMFSASMKEICEDYEFEGLIKLGPAEDERLNARLKACAATVWDRWQNRATQGWCEHCGKGGAELMQCGGCGKVSYCSKDHQKLGWRLHKLTCDSKKRS